MTLDKRSVFLGQFLVLVVLVLLTLLDIELTIVAALLSVGLVGLWMVGAIIEPFSLLLSALALAGTTSTLSLLNISGIPFSVNGLLTAGLGAACGLALLVHFQHHFRSLRQIRRWVLESAPLSLLLIWAVVRTPGAPRLNDAISDLLIWTTIILVYALARTYWTDNPRALADGAKAFIYVAFLPLAMIVIDALFGNVFFNTTDNTLSPGLHTSSGSRSIPAFMGLSLIPLLGELRFGQATPHMNRRLLVGVVAVISMWIFFSLGRTALLGAAGIVFPLMLIAPRSLWKAAAITVVGVGLTAAVIQSPIYPRPSVGSLGDVINIEDEPSQSEGSGETNGNGARQEGSRVSINTGVLRGITYGRTGVWEQLIGQVVDEHPITGFGTGASREDVKATASTWDNPHNDYVRVFYDLGAIGLLIFVLSWMIRLLVSWQNWIHLRADTFAAARNFTALVAGGYILLNFMTDNFIVYFFIMGPFALLLAMASAATVHVEARETMSTLAPDARPILRETQPRASLESEN